MKIKIDNYKIDRKSHPYLIYIGIGMIFINLILHYKFKGVDYLNPLAIFDKNAMTALGIDSILLILRVFMTIIAFIVAKRLMRSGIFWAICTFLFPPISLIILGLIDVKIDYRLKKILDRYRTNYFVEIVKIKNDLKRGKNDESNIVDLIDKSKQKHQELLTKALNARKIELEKTETEDWMDDISKCPACGADVNMSDKICPNCKLNLF
jgi:hypothetical protein